MTIVTSPRLPVRSVLSGLLAFMVINAFGGGVDGVSGAPGVPIEWLDGTPFRSYFVPGLVLLVIVGGSALGASVAVAVRARFARPAALGAGLVMLGWMVVQVLVLGYVSWLQPAVFVAAAAIVLLALTIPIGPACTVAEVK